MKLEKKKERIQNELNDIKPKVEQLAQQEIKFPIGQIDALQQFLVGLRRFNQLAGQLQLIQELEREKEDEVINGTNKSAE